MKTDRERILSIVNMRLDGLTLKQIAQKHGITKQRVDQLLNKLTKRTDLEEKKYAFVNIAQWLVRTNTTAKSLSKQLGVTDTTIFNYLYGKTSMPVKIVVQLMKITGLTFEEIIFEKPKDEPESDE
jgi:transcriptional regulator with XRE-family HTH domain